MTMIEIYRQRKPALIQRIKESKSLYETGSVISETFETIKYRYLAENANRDFSQKVSDLIDFAKTTIPLIESVNKYKLWENAEDAKPKKKNLLPGFIMLLIGMALVFVPIGYHMYIQLFTVTEFRGYLTSMLIGCLVILVSGFMLFFRRRIKNKTTIEIYADAEDIVSRIETVLKQIDILLEKEKRYIIRREKQLRTAINEDELTLFSYLMEAKFSGQRDFAMEQLDEVEHYLAKQDVIQLKYSKGNEKYFDFLEGEETKTIRPAFIRDGEILKKGLAQITQ